ncbi:MAG: HlyD family efflux transporter periplasmic adaptor subunit [Paracoccaceae bacterium]|nr:HlyD family efflux transporter periplasmic adaptor subunit [Paracoccaceae bacterium]
MKRWLFPALSVIALLALGGWALWPRAELVDLVTITRAPMETTVEAEGMTRVRAPYLVTAPITGTTVRSPVEVGDAVIRGQTVVAEIHPAEPAFLDARARAQAEATVTETQAAVRLAEANITRAEADLVYARGEYDRNQELAARGIVPSRTLEAALQARQSAEAALNAARSELDLNRATLAKAQAQLVAPEDPGADIHAASCCVAITAPASGTVLTIEDRSARLVQAGAPLLTIGDVQDLEIEVDLLSSDAVKVALGAPAHIERWGGRRRAGRPRDPDRACRRDQGLRAGDRRATGETAAGYRDPGRGARGAWRPVSHLCPHRHLGRRRRVAGAAIGAVPAGCGLGGLYRTRGPRGAGAGRDRAQQCAGGRGGVGSDRGRPGSGLPGQPDRGWQPHHRAPLTGPPAAGP